MSVEETVSIPKIIWQNLSTWLAQLVMRHLMTNGAYIFFLYAKYDQNFCQLPKRLQRNPIRNTINKDL